MQKYVAGLVIMALLSLGLFGFRAVVEAHGSHHITQTTHTVAVVHAGCLASNLMSQEACSQSAATDPLGFLNSHLNVIRQLSEALTLMVLLFAALLVFRLGLSYLRGLQPSLWAYVRLYHRDPTPQKLRALDWLALHQRILPVGYNG